MDGGATWRSVKAPRYPQLDYNGHTIAFDPAKPSTALMIGAHGATLGTLYRSIDAGLSWKRVRPAGTLRGAVVDQFAFASDGRALALVRIGDRQRATFASLDGGLHWSRCAVADARHEVAAGVRLAARGERHDVPARHEPARLLAPAAGRAAVGRGVGGQMAHAACATW